MQGLCGVQTPAGQMRLWKKDKDMMCIHCPSANETYIFGSQKLHAFGHLVGKTEQIGGGEALVHVF